MKSKLTLSELFELAKNAAPVMQAGEIESLTGKGIASPLAARAAFKPRRILQMFNPTRILIMTTIAVIITSIALILNPFRDKTSDTKQDPAGARQNADRVESRKIALPGVEAVPPKITEPQEPERESISMGVPVKAPAQTAQADAKDTVFEGEILRLSKEELTKLGFIFDQEGYYYLNQLPDGSKLNFWSFKGSQGGSYGFGAGGYINQSNKATLQQNDFYPLITTNLLGAEINAVHQLGKVNEELFERMNDTLVPVYFSIRELGGYETSDRLVWFRASEGFFKLLGIKDGDRCRIVNERAKLFSAEQPGINHVYYNYSLVFPKVVTLKVGYDVLNCIGVKATPERIEYKFTYSGNDYSWWADKTGMGTRRLTFKPAAETAGISSEDSMPLLFSITRRPGNSVGLPKCPGKVNIDLMIPLQLNDPDAVTFIQEVVFWINPNDRFFDCLPPEIAEPMRKEFAYQQKRLDPGFVPKMGGSIGIKGDGLAGDTTHVIGSLGIGVNLKQDSIDIDSEPVPCVYFTNLCESLSGVDYVNLYPNPARDNLTIDLVLQSSKEIRFRVLDLGGRVISDDSSPVSFSGGGQVQHRVDVSRLKNGLYLLLMTDEEGARLTRRFVKN